MTKNPRNPTSTKPPKGGAVPINRGRYPHQGEVPHCAALSCKIFSSKYLQGAQPQFSYPNRSRQSPSSNTPKKEGTKYPTFFIQGICCWCNKRLQKKKPIIQIPD